MHFVIVSLDDPSCVSSASLEQFYEALFLESLSLVPLCSHVYIAECPTEHFLLKKFVFLNDVAIGIDWTCHSLNHTHVGVA